MRIFIALLFDETAKRPMVETLNKVKEIAIKGRFTATENLHLTLLFLGETSSDELAEIHKKLAEIRLGQFHYTTQDIQAFKRGRNQRIVYLGIEKSAILQRLYQRVCQKLADLGLEFKNKTYTPHITLGRQVTLSSDHDLENINTTPQVILANRISIMESTRVHGRLTYIELASIPLLKEEVNHS